MKPRDIPTVSILIPAHDASVTIGIALLSVWITRPPRSEIVVLLDGDNTESKVLNFMETRKEVRIFRSSEILGISKARNFLLDKAKSDFVAWLDADDIALPLRYRKSLEMLGQEKSDVVFSNSIIFGPKLRVLPFLPQFPYSISAELSSLFLWQSNPFVQSTMVARKSVILEVGGYRDCPAEDYDLWMRLAARGHKLTRRSSFGVLYRVHDGQTTLSPSYVPQALEDPAVRQSHQGLTLRILDSKALAPGTSLLSQIKETLLSESRGYRIQEKLFRRVLDSSKRRFL